MRISLPHGARRWNQGRHISWRNGSLRRKLGLDSACSSMANVTGRDKDRIAESKCVRADLLAIVDTPQVAQTCILRALGLQTFVLFFVSFLFPSYVFIEAATLRSIVLRYACALTVAHNYPRTVCVPLVLFFFSFFFFSFFFFGDVAFSEFFCTIVVYSLVWRVRRMCFPPSG